MHLDYVQTDQSGPHALTFDLEDWHELGWRLFGYTSSTSRHVIASTYRILDLLDELNIRSTFFVLGLVAATYPELVQEVAKRGHEIGSHSDCHERVWSMTRERFRADVERAKKALEDLTGRPVRGFRAPEFSINAVDHWAFDALAEVGFVYDSSIYPASFARYGVSMAPRKPFVVQTQHGVLWEFPLATWRIGRTNWPVGGGSYFRVIPRQLLGLAFKAIEREKGHAVYYFHPYEFQDGWLSLAGLKPRERLRPCYWKAITLYNFNTKGIEMGIRKMFAGHRFMPLGELYDSFTELSSRGAEHEE